VNRAGIAILIELLSLKKILLIYRQLSSDLKMKFRQDSICRLTFAGKNILNPFSETKSYQKLSMRNVSHRDYSCIHNMIESIEKNQLYSGRFNNADEFF